MYVPWAVRGGAWIASTGNTEDLVGGRTRGEVVCVCKEAFVLYTLKVMSYRWHLVSTSRRAPKKGGNPVGFTAACLSIVLTTVLTTACWLLLTTSRADQEANYG